MAFYSFRKLDEYDGAIVKLRRSSDDKTKDFFASGDGVVSINKILAWSEDSDVFVVTWYDQSKTGANLIQETASQQPKFIADELYPHLVLDGVNDQMTTADTFNFASGYAIANYTEGASFVNFPGLFGVSAGASSAGVVGGSGTSLLEAHAGATFFVNGKKTLATGGTLSTPKLYHTNNVSVYNQPLRLGQERGTANRYWGGKVYELRTWGVTLKNNDRIAIEDEIATFYGFLSLAAKKRVFIFAGQSNMTGADADVAGTGAAGLSASGLSQAADRQALFSFASTSSGTDVYGLDIIDGHEDSSGSGNYVHGPEVGFIRKLAETEDVSDVVILKFAANWTVLESSASPWIKGNSLYTALAAEVTQRLGELDALGFRYVFSGFCWAQGIDDGIEGRTQVEYTTDLTQIIADLRGDYSAERFVLSRSVNSTIAGQSNMLPIRHGQVAVAESDEEVFWVDLDDLTPYVGTHHLSSASQIVHGERMATAMLSGRKQTNPAYADETLYTLGNLPNRKKARFQKVY